MKVYTTVEVTIGCAHIGPFHDRIHGHTYRVTAKFLTYEPPRDSGALHALLDGVLAPLDHSTLDAELGREYATAEGIAAYVLGTLMPHNCKRVGVWRLDGSGAEAEL